MENYTLYNLTNPQKSIYYTELLYKNSSIGNISGTLHIRTKIDFEALEMAVKSVIKNNDALRTRIIMQENNPVQFFAEYEECKVELIDVKDENELELLEKKLVSIPFEDKTKSLAKFTLFRFPNGCGGCNVINSHLISDAWSSTMICSEVVRNYIRILNKNDDENNQLSYREFIKSEEEYRQSKIFAKDKEYWESKFELLPELATTNTEDIESINCSANRIIKVLTEEESKKIQEYCEKNKISVYCFFLTIYAIYLSRITGIENIVLGTPLLNRKNINDKKTLGMYVNTIPININLAENKNIKDVFTDSTREILSVLRHQRYSYIDLLEYIRNKHNINRGLYDVIISYQNAKTTANTSEIPYSANWNFNGCLSETLNIHISDIDTTNKLNIYYDYQLSKHSKEDIDNIHNRAMYIIEQILNEDITLLDDIDIVPKNEKEIINSLNLNNAKYPTNKTIVDLFEEQVKLTPNNIAVTINDKVITYTELNEQANKLANLLIKKGVKSNTPVALRMNKSIEMIVGILAIIKSGGCYLPIDLSYPIERMDFMIKDSNAKLLLTNKKSKPEIEGIEIIEIDDTALYSNNDIENINTKINPDDILYIIYTSGSTGTPKGAMITHKNVVRLMKNDKFLFDFNSSDVWTMFHSVAFDFSVWEMYGALLYGGKLVLVPENIAKDPSQFLSLMRKEKVTILNQTPTFFYNLLDCEIKNEDSNLCIRYIIYGGEALKPNLIKKWKEKYSFTKLINMYGITETTVHVTYKEITDEDMQSSNSNIGKPIPTLQVFIMDKKQRLLPLGIEGEICVSGDGVCKGYLNREDLNNEKFIKNPFNSKSILYRSADSAILKSDGNLYYKGRIDTQVKIRGFRVELGEIENKLLRHEAISKCVVLENKNSDKDSHLVAYIVCNRNVRIDELKTYLKDLLPPYMIPNHFIKIKEMPTNSNGKIDRKYLKTLDYTIEERNIYVEPRNEFEKVLAEIIEEELKIKKVGIDDDILDLGADSLSLMRITASLLEKDYEVNIQSFYEQKTIRNINDSINIKNIDIANTKELNTNLYFEFDNEFNNEKVDIQNVLLLGSTGFLGIHILYDLLKKLDVSIYCLIRDKDGKNGEERLKDKIKFYFNKESNEIINEFGNRIFVINGDISKENFGLNEIDYNNIGYKIDTIIHSAAIVNHYGKKEIFELINVIGTQNVIDFCKKYHVKLNYISTSSVSADFVADKELNEEFNEKSLYIGQPYYKNIYVKTKFEAEFNIWKEKDNGLEFIIYRLGNITSRYKDGKFQENDYQNAFLNRMLNFVKLGSTTEELLNYEFDMSPVDICSDFITQLMQFSSSYNKVFHILNENKITLKDILKALKITDIEVVSKQELMRRIKNNTNKLGLINDITSKSLLVKNIKINSDFSNQYLKKLGLTWLKIDEKYIRKYISLGDTNNEKE